MKLLTFISICFIFNLLPAQQNARYWVAFSNKANSHFSIHQPTRFLSQRAIERRARLGILVNKQDLPVNKHYLDSIKAKGLHLINVSRWFNAALFEVADTSKLSEVKKLPFVTKIEKRRDAIHVQSNSAITQKWLNTGSNELNNTEHYYGWGYRPLNQLGAETLHANGYKGQGVHIAILDAGFTGTDTTLMFSKLWDNELILGYSDFVNPGGNVFAHSTHGTIVLGTLAANIPYKYVGIAPDASYWLLRTEDSHSEYPSEEDHWIAAIEFADSAGVDIINTSLGYKDFDNPVYNHSYEQLNGKTLRISKAAQMAAERGILLTVSAGNSGNSNSPFIGAPADAPEIITVGATDTHFEKTDFSSVGPTADGRLKPELVAPGTQIPAFRNTGWEPGTARGTSFSAPLLAGLAACIMQAYPHLFPNEIINALQKTASHSAGPNNMLGYGTPNGEYALSYLKSLYPVSNNTGKIFPMPVIDFVFIEHGLPQTEKISIECFDLAGRKQFVFSDINKETVFISEPIQKLASGIYILRCSGSGKPRIYKIIKTSGLHVNNY
jgi:hypothetical protein